jgi:hypothetical protein
MAMWIAGAALALAVGLAIVGVVTIRQLAADLYETNLETTRNFYGVLRVNRAENRAQEYGPLIELVHGRIRHGFQYIQPPQRRLPTTYYGPKTGLGMAIEHHPRRKSRISTEADREPSAGANPGDGTLRIGVIGLGCGTIAAYGKQGDTIRFYDINPQVVHIAKEYFTYCKDSAATVEIVVGDARINLEKELAAGQVQRFDVLAVDAFSSDSIPMHLLTKECVELYRRHLQPDGLLCLHVSNRYLNLEGVARGAAQVLGCECIRIETDSDYEHGLDSTTWIVVTANRPFLNTPEVRLAISKWTDGDPAPLVWTDDYGSLWQTINF